MSIFSQFYKKIQSKLEGIFSPAEDSVKDKAGETDVCTNTPCPPVPLGEEEDGKNNAKDKCSELPEPQIISEESISQSFKPQILDNGRTLLLGLSGDENNKSRGVRQQHSPPSSAENVPITTLPSDQPRDLSMDEISSILDAPVEEEIDAPIVYKLKCFKCGVNGKLDSFAETFVCPMCGGTMYLIEAYANHSQHSPEEIKQRLCVLYSQSLRGDPRARRTWALLTSKSHSDRVLETYMQQYINSHDSLNNTPQTQQQKLFSPSLATGYYKHPEASNNAGSNHGTSTRESSPSVSPNNPPVFTKTYIQKTDHSTTVSHRSTPIVAKPLFLIPELEQIYKSVNGSNSVKSFSSNNEQSLLRSLGYKVGKSSKLKTPDRRKVLVKAFVADTSTINSKWNKAMTQGRVTALITLLRRLNDSDSYKLNDFSVAIRQRNEDISWMLNYAEFVNEAIRIANNNLT